MYPVSPRLMHEVLPTKAALSRATPPPHPTPTCTPTTLQVLLLSAAFACCRRFHFPREKARKVAPPTR